MLAVLEDAAAALSVARMMVLTVCRMAGEDDMHYGWAIVSAVERCCVKEKAAWETSREAASCQQALRTLHALETPGAIHGRGPDSRYTSVAAAARTVSPLPLLTGIARLQGRRPKQACFPVAAAADEANLAAAAVGGGSSSPPGSRTAHMAQRASALRHPRQEHQDCQNLSPQPPQRYLPTFDSRESWAEASKGMRS